MESDSSNDDDYDEQMQDLETLSAALHDEPTVVDSTSIRSESTSTSQTTNQHELSRIESALALNKIMDEKYKRLETILKTRLQDCRKKLADNSKAISIKPPKPDFRYYSCGKPYFKDGNFVGAPDNEDTIFMKKSEMYDFSSVLSVPGWTVRDKNLLINTLHELSKNIRKAELTSQINKLKRENSQKNKNQIVSLQRELNNVKKKSLAEIALPIDQDYDWETVAHNLNWRHSAEEYKALWKIFFHPSINKSSWTREEHKKLQEIAIKHKEQDWDMIAKKLNTRRTGYQCFVYYRTNLNTGNIGKWTVDEIEYLKRLISYYKEGSTIPWGKVASVMGNRTKIQVYNKYLTIAAERKGRFLPEEDTVILSCVKDFGHDWKKMTQYLPGRTVHQIRIRYSLLTKMRVSTTWTVEEDKKLLQVMANQDNVYNFSVASKYFPGKDRVSIRTRYLTLQRWMKTYPHYDIEYAPRRAARQLQQGQPNDLMKSLENLKNRMECEVSKKFKPGQVTNESPEEVIENAIMTKLLTDVLKEEGRQLVEGNDDNTIEAYQESETKINEANLKSVLMVLNAKLNKSRFIKSVYFENFPNLTKNENIQSKLKCYSKKETGNINAQTGERPNLWGKGSFKRGKYVLPPNLTTITGCRVLMNHISTKFSIPKDNGINLPMMCRHNKKLEQCLTMLKWRFMVLFLWPILLSNVSPRERVDAPGEVHSYEINGFPVVVNPNKAGPSKMGTLNNESDNESQEDIATAVSDFSSTDDEDL